jgi:predicted ATP-binding protein involved in virulence
MKLKHLNLTNIRAFSRAEFSFEPGVNLIVGINGAGKSTVLDSLCVLLSQALVEWYGYGISVRFSGMDIKVDSSFVQAEVIFDLYGHELSYTMHALYGKNRSTLKSTTEVTLRREINLVPTIQPRVIYYSPRQNLSSTKKFIKIAKDSPDIFIDVVDRRELRLTEFAEWWLAQNALVTEKAPNAQRHIDALNTAVKSFIDACTNVRVERETSVYEDKNGNQTERSITNLLIDKAGVTLDPQQLSDGERGMLALALDLTRRLSQANPDLANPLEGEAIVLIDELDLHLHPQWQRTIVKKLTTTFPNCQFIATTHSPLIIGEVEPSGLILLKQEDNGIKVVQQGLQGFGLDSSWILQHLMDTDSRNSETQEQIDLVEDALEEGDLGLAHQHLNRLKTMIHGDDNEVIRLEASINNLEALADAVDTEAE